MISDSPLTRRRISTGPVPDRVGAGRGGMGEVYRARDATLHRDVALKVLPEPFALDVDRLARFIRGHDAGRRTGAAEHAAHDRRRRAGQRLGRRSRQRACRCTTTTSRSGRPMTRSGIRGRCAYRRRRISISTCPTPIRTAIPIDRRARHATDPNVKHLVMAKGADTVKALSDGAEKGLRGESSRPDHTLQKACRMARGQGYECGRRRAAGDRTRRRPVAQRTLAAHPDRPGRIGIRERRARQVGSREVDVLEVTPRDRRARQVRTDQHRGLEVRVVDPRSR